MKIARIVKWTFVIAITLAVAGVIAFVAMWGRRTESSQIRPEGPFAHRFSNLYGEGPGSMTEYRSERLEAWFRSVLPVGTDRAKCRYLLNESFGVDLTSGDFVVIDKMSVFPAGGEETKVRLIFDRDGRFQDVEVRQNLSCNESLLVGLPVDTLPIHLHLAILETEAWFLEEISHFSRINNGITDAKLIANGFDHVNIRAHSLENPAKTLRKIYKSVGEQYKKNKRSIQRTVNELSYEELYINTRSKAPSLDGFITSLEAGIF